LDGESYRRGFEDAVELCLSEISRAKSLEEAGRRVGDVLSLVKEDKLERLKQMLWLVER